ncbi:phage tail protein [Pseudoalteromonas sp. MMG013]|uniref:phage tail protein n=1 Tax=Pseudoalteromonas sp. MMG013 TaxID=2822687 RepID=UPI001B35D4AE|nr:phage tail protein [Pseudoalteromonas sp. MMG013]MBQ4864473.1 phage tail protein [Pseudoalteromonas sp. MMG013]
MQVTNVTHVKQTSPPANESELQPQALLPPNHSQLQQQALLSQQHAPYNDAISQLTNLKAQPNDALLMWLVWEYGLEAILPYSTNLRQTLKDGLAWQRIRGTPKSLELALSWLNLPAVHIENTAPGRHHYTYQLDLGELPKGRTSNVTKLAQLSAPVSAKLTRLYHGYDIRNQTLSGERSGFGHILSDYSGVPVFEHGKMLCKASFGNRSSQLIDSSVQQLHFGHHRTRIKTSEQLDIVQPWRYYLSGNVPSRLPNQLLRHRTTSQQKILAQRGWVGTWQGGWGGDLHGTVNGSQGQLCKAVIAHSQIRTVQPLYFAGANTGRMNFGTLNMTSKVPNS